MVYISLMIAYLCLETVEMETQCASDYYIKYPHPVKVHHPTEREQYECNQWETIKSKGNRDSLE